MVVNNGYYGQNIVMNDGYRGYSNDEKRQRQRQRQVYDSEVLQCWKNLVDRGQSRKDQLLKYNRNKPSSFGKVMNKAELGLICNDFKSI